jgi:hypothetical protein
VAQPASVAPSLELTGHTVAERYVLTGLLGRGGFGTVYSGRDLTGAGEVAVKVFSRSEGFASRAAREARTATKLDHPNIVHVYSVVPEYRDNLYGKLLKQERLVEKELPQMKIEFHVRAHQGREPFRAVPFGSQPLFIR